MAAVFLFEIRGLGFNPNVQAMVEPCRLHNDACLHPCPSCLAIFYDVYRTPET